MTGDQPAGSVRRGAPDGGSPALWHSMHSGNGADEAAENGAGWRCGRNGCRTQRTATGAVSGLVTTATELTEAATHASDTHGRDRP